MRYLLIGEALLILLALAWARIRSIDLPFERSPRDVVVSLGITCCLIGVNYVLYRVGRWMERPAAVYRFLDTEVVPLFEKASFVDLILLAGLAGVGEEMLFRGVLQSELGLLPASLLFGILHGPMRSLWPLALWAGVMGLLLGLVYEISGNLSVPVLVHALYDAAALLYVRAMAQNRAKAAFPEP